MKKVLLIIIFSLPLKSLTQNKTFTIQWNEPRTLITSNSSEKVPSFKNGFSFSHDKGLIFFHQWKITQPINESNVAISDITYEIISDDHLFDLKKKTIPHQIAFKLRNVKGRGQLSAYAEVSPIINENGVLKKITSFSLNFTYSNNSRHQHNTLEISSSVLKTGDWYRFRVDKTGVYKLSKSFLASLGLNTNVNPRTIKIYGQGGQMLPLSNSANYPFDLTENAIKFIGEDDEIFNDDDYILFYGEGNEGFNEESNTHINLYSEVSYYYVTSGVGLGKRIQALQEPLLNPTVVIESYDSYKFHEMDTYNPTKLGRRWFGDLFDIENEKTFEFEFPNIDTSQPVKVKVHAAATSTSETTMEVMINGNVVDNFSFPEVDDTILGGSDFYPQIPESISVTSPNIVVALHYDNAGNPSSLAYVDYISVEAKEHLIHTNQQFILKNKDVASMSGIGQYNISNATNISEVWDITDKYNITAKVNNDLNTIFSFKASLGEERTYLVIDSGDYYSPIKVPNSYVVNQDIKGSIFYNNQGEFEDIDYIIITRNDMLVQAERLAQINRTQYDLNVKILTLDNIYLEFSSGNPDIAAIRNLVKYVYDNGSSDANRLKYLCLFGDASFDYKDRISGNTNIVPSWYSYNSFVLTNSFISDDFYGMMDASEGQMENTDRLDIAVGRIVADTPKRAKDLIDKIENYYSEASFGSYKNNILLIADDIDDSEIGGPWEARLQETSNAVADDITTNKPFINAKKIFADAYIQSVSPAGERYLEANKDIFDTLEAGVLVANYFGHGGEDGLASERIFDKIDAQELLNNCRLNCFITITCEYFKFDNPQRITAGEYLYWNTNGGAISLITTTRKIYVDFGVDFNLILEQHLFGYGTNNYVSMAEALRITKNAPEISVETQSKLISFIGDPAMKLLFPQSNIRMTAVNDVPVTEGIEILQALSTAKIEGEITDASGNVLTDYNGILTATIYDKEIQRSTLGNDGVQTEGALIILDYKTLGNIVFKGQASIVNGQFEFDFIVPRDIRIPVGHGKVSFYAKENGQLSDHTGYSFDVKIGGLNNNAPEDHQGPTINLYMNDDNFVSGGITNNAPSIVAKLYDENGINTASGIGHDIVAIIDGDVTNPFKLNDYYISDIDDYQRGTLNYPLRDLTPGPHTLTLKAWDVYNNSSETEIQFVVHDENEQLVITNVLNYPNPFVNYTEFWFNHNSSDVLDVSVQIFTISGKLVKTLNAQTNVNGNCCGTSTLSRDIVWDGRDDYGDKIAKGVYVYKLTVRSNLLNKQVVKTEKLVIL